MSDDTHPQHANPWVIDATEENFAREAIERSRETAVVVDFWAPWCGPCRRLGPILESLAAEFQGRFVLVKANTEAVPGIAASFNVQSIPAVFALRGEQIVDQFVGVLPEGDLRRWLDHWLPGPADLLTAAAERQSAADPLAAEAQFRRASAADPKHAAAKLGLARVLLAQHRLPESRELVDELAARGYLEPEAERLQAELKLRGLSEGSGDLANQRALAAQAPRDWPLQWKLAQALVAAGEHEEALRTCLQLVEFDGPRTGQQAKEMMLDLFRLLGPTSPLTMDYRRQLSMLLY